jgi:hypothetical protein
VNLLFQLSSRPVLAIFDELSEILKGIPELLEVLFRLLNRLPELLGDPPLSFKKFPPPVELSSQLFADLPLFSEEFSSPLMTTDEEDAEEVFVEVEPKLITLPTVC